MKNNATQKMKRSAVLAPDMSKLTKEHLKEEIEKGFADAAAGRVTPAVEAFAHLRKEHQSSISQF